MPAKPDLSSTSGYAEDVASLIGRYEALSFETIHGPLLPRFPKASSRVIDIGAGTGRDALIAMTLRHGPVPEGRCMFDVSGIETSVLAGRHGLTGPDVWRTSIALRAAA